MLKVVVLALGLSELCFFHRAVDEHHSYLGAGVRLEPQALGPWL